MERMMLAPGGCWSSWGRGRRGGVGEMGPAPLPFCTGAAAPPEEAPSAPGWWERERRGGRPLPAMADSTGEDVGGSQAAAAKKGRGSSWQYQETVALLQLWGQKAVQEELRSSHRNLETFQRIAHGMRQRGYPRGPAECRIKTKKLKGEYKQALQRRAEPGCGGHDEARRWPFFRMLSRILREEQPGAPEGSPGDRPAAAFQENGNEATLDRLVKEEEDNNAEDAGERTFPGPASGSVTPRTSESQPASDPEGPDPAAATASASPPAPARLAWMRRRKTKSAKVESLLLQMLHQDAEEARETREAVEHSWARMEAWARAEQESRARDAELERRHRQEVLACMRQTNELIRRFVGDTSQLLHRVLESPRTEDGPAGAVGATGNGRTAPGSRPAGHHPETKQKGAAGNDAGWSSEGLL